MSQKFVTKVNPTILKWAREQCGFSYEEAAGKSLKAKKLIEIENGNKYLTFNQLLNISKKYGRNPAFFYLKEIPYEDLIEDFRTLESSKIKFSPKLRREIYIIKDKRELAVEFQEYDKNYDYSYVNSISLNDSIKNIAKKILEYLKISFELKENWKDEYIALNGWKEAIEEQGILIFNISKIDIVEMRAFSISEIPYPVIALNRSDSPFGRIFSLIHEFCHIMLQKGGICTYNSEDENLFEIESFCNAVAGEVLVPSEALLANRSVKEHSHLKEWNEEELKLLSRYFKVSSEVILRRLLTLNLTTKAYYKEMIQIWKERRRYKTTGGGEKGYELVLRKNSLNFIKY